MGEGGVMRGGAVLYKVLQCMGLALIGSRSAAAGFGHEGLFLLFLLWT